MPCASYVAVAFSVLCALGAFMPAPVQASETPYLALVVRAPKASYNWTVDALEQALMNVGNWAPRGTYGHMAAHMHIRDKDWTRPSTARRVGNEIGLTQVLFVSIRTAKGGDHKTFADIELVDVRGGNVLVKRSYFLADHRMSAGTATYVADFLALRLNVHRHDDPSDGSDEGVAQSRFGEMHGRDLDDAPPPPPAPVRHPHAKKSSVAFLQGIL